MLLLMIYVAIVNQHLLLLCSLQITWHYHRHQLLQTKFWFPAKTFLGLFSWPSEIIHLWWSEVPAQKAQDSSIARFALEGVCVSQSIWLIRVQLKFHEWQRQRVEKDFCNWIKSNCPWINFHMILPITPPHLQTPPKTPQQCVRLLCSNNIVSHQAFLAAASTT